MIVLQLFFNTIYWSDKTFCISPHIFIVVKPSRLRMKINKNRRVFYSLYWYSHICKFLWFYGIIQINNYGNTRVISISSK